MLTIGIDAHKRTHTAVALDEAGRKVDEITVGAAREGVVDLLDWADRLDGQRRWAVEDCRHVTGLLEAVLCDRDEQAVRVPPHMTGSSRRGQRTAGKSDPIDAEAVARACLTTDDLPVARPDDPGLAALKAVYAYREQAVSARTELINRLRWALHQLDPQWAPANLTSLKQLNGVRDQLTTRTGVDASIGVRQVDRIISLTLDINDITLQLVDLVNEVVPELLTIEGCGPITAAAIAVNVGDVGRFATEHKLARYAGVAPIPASSGNNRRMRLHRGGNRQLNAAIHRISLTQTRDYPPAIAYLNNKISQGHTKREARRAHKTHITRRVYRTLKQAQLT